MSGGIKLLATPIYGTFPELGHPYYEVATPIFSTLSQMPLHMMRFSLKFIKTTQKTRMKKPSMKTVIKKAFIKKP